MLKELIQEKDKENLSLLQEMELIKIKKSNNNSNCNTCHNSLNTSPDKNELEADLVNLNQKYEKLKTNAICLIEKYKPK